LGVFFFLPLVAFSFASPSGPAGESCVSPTHPSFQFRLRNPLAPIGPFWRGIVRGSFSFWMSDHRFLCEFFLMAPPGAAPKRPFGFPPESIISTASGGSLGWPLFTPLCRHLQEGFFFVRLGLLQRLRSPSLSGAPPYSFFFFCVPSSRPRGFRQRWVAELVNFSAPGPVTPSLEGGAVLRHGVSGLLLSP